MPIPSDIPGLGLWLEADRITGLADGASLTTWTDASGSGHNANPYLSLGSAPVWRSAAVNGQPAVQFTGNTPTSTPLVAVGWGTALSGLTAYTLFMVVQETGVLGDYPIVTTAPTNGPWQWITEFDVSGGFYVGGPNAGYRQYTTGYSSGTLVQFTFMQTVTGPHFYKTTGGATAEVTAYSLGPSGDIASIVPALGTDVLIGGYYNSNYGLNGYLCALIWYNRTLSDSERLSVETYLQKWFVVPGVDLASTSSMTIGATVIEKATVTELAGASGVYVGQVVEFAAVPMTAGSGMALGAMVTELAAVTETALAHLGVAGSVTRAPPPVPGYYSWHDASQITGQSDNTPLATWPDLSGNGHDLLQTVSASQPTYYSSTAGQTINGLPAVWFNGNSNFMRWASTVAPILSTTFFVVLKDVRGTGSIFLDGINATERRSILDYVGQWEIYAGTEVFFSASDTGLHVLAAVFNDTNSYFDLDGTVNGPVSVGTQPFTGLMVGTYASRAYYFDGAMCEVLIYPSALSVTDRQSVRSYLTNKWAPPPVAVIQAATAGMTVGASVQDIASVALSASVALNFAGNLPQTITGQVAMGATASMMEAGKLTENDSIVMAAVSALSATLNYLPKTVNGVVSMSSSASLAVPGTTKEIAAVLVTAVASLVMDATVRLAGSTVFTGVSSMRVNVTTTPGVKVNMAASTSMWVIATVVPGPLPVPPSLADQIAAVIDQDPILLGATGYLDDVYTSRLVGDTD